MSSFLTIHLMRMPKLGSVTPRAGSKASDAALDGCRPSCMPKGNARKNKAWHADAALLRGSRAESLKADVGNV